MLVRIALVQIKKSVNSKNVRQRKKIKMQSVGSLKSDGALCVICRDPLLETDRKVLSCCSQVLHNGCLEGHLKEGFTNCCFCREPLPSKEIPWSIRSIGAVRKAVEQQKRFARHQAHAATQGHRRCAPSKQGQRHAHHHGQETQDKNPARRVRCKRMDRCEHT